MEPRISIITLGVADLARSARFYQEGLGLPRREEGGAEIVFFETHGTWLALFPLEALAQDAGVPLAEGGSPTFTLAHNVRTREEVDQLPTHAVRWARDWSNRLKKPPGAATPATSPIPTATCGK